MSPARRYRPLLLLATLLALGAAAGTVAAQQRPAPQRPAARADSARAAADTTRPAPPSNPAVDSLLQRLRRMDGYVPIEYLGESAIYRSDEGTLRLQGKAQVERTGDRLTADTIVYQQQDKLVRAYGSPTVSGQQASDIQGDSLLYDFDRRRATVRGGRTTFTEGATWLVQGDVTAEGGDRFYTREGCFTTDDRFGMCAPREGPLPQYHFEADRILMVREKVIVARPARLYFRNVPVFWLPFIVQNLERGRRSGLLVPEFSLNDIVQTRRTQREISNLGFYWAINDYLGAQLSGGWRSGAFTEVTGALEYRWRRQFLDGNFSTRRYWPRVGPSQFSLSTRTGWRPTERTSLSVDGNYQSSGDFVRRNTTEPGEATQDLSSNLRLDHQFDWGSVNFGATRRQSLSNDRVEMTLPSLSISPKTITLFRSSATEPAWYNNGSLTLNGSGRRSITDEAENPDPRRLTRDSERWEVSGNQSLQLGNLLWSSTAALNRAILGSVAARDSFVAIPERNSDRGNWSSNLSYQIPLVGSTRLAPGISFSQDFRRDSLVMVGEAGDTTVLYDELVTSPLRTSFNVGLSPELYGFFPGIGPYSAIRHRLSPSISYSYSPAVTPDARQRAAFGAGESLARNVVSLSLNQTFEAKLREVEAPDTVAPLTGDSLQQAGTAPRRRAVDPRKVKLLGLQTSAIAYDFERASRGLNGITTASLSNTVDSDYLRGLNLSFTHDLFDESTARSATTPTGVIRDQGRFSPYLTSVSTRFELGPGSGIFRFLGLGGGRSQSIADTNRGLTPGAAPPSQPTEGESVTLNRRPVGGGTWNLSVEYGLERSRERRDSTGTVVFGGSEMQSVNARLSFPLTPNWGLNWSTNYSITDNEFGYQQLSLVRDLYRWQASFNFSLTETGNTTFNFAVHLRDLPDLKFDYREQYRGTDDPARR